MHPRLAELTEYLAQQRQSVLAAAAVVPSALWTARPAPDRWSVSQILEHLHRVERGAAAILTKRIQRAAAAGHPRETETSAVLGILEPFAVSDRGRRRDAPSLVEPTDNPDRETVEQRLAESRAALLDALESGDGLALGEIRHTHLIFGDLDLYQWILLVGEHEKRHALQIHETAALLAPAA